MLLLEGPPRALAPRTMNGEWDRSPLALASNNGGPGDGKSGGRGPADHATDPRNTPNASATAETVESVDDVQPYVTVIRPNAGAYLFAALTINTVYLWSVRPHVMVAKVIRSELTVIEDGENVDIIWNPDSSSLAVVTHKGFLHFYELVFSNSKSLEFQFLAPHHFVSGPGERFGVSNVTLKFRMALEIDTGFSCGIGLADELLLCTANSPSLLSMSWSGAVSSDSTVALSSLDFYSEPDMAIAQIAANLDMDLFGWVSLTGKAYVTQRIPRNPDDRNDSFDEADPGGPDFHWVGLCFHNSASDDSPAVIVSINSRLLLLAVGDEAGNIFVYSLSDDRSELRFSHKLSPSPTPTKSLGSVLSLEWSPDGNALAASWVNGGLCIWSVFGRLLMSSMADDSDSSSECVLSRGISHMFWGNFELFVLPSTLRNHEVLVLSCIESALVGCQNMDNVKNAFMLCDDKILFYEGNFPDFDAMNLDLMQWRSIQIPIMYAAGNWPIKHASVNPTAHYLAIAGSRGIAHYSTLTNKWKLLGSELQEQSFSVSGGGMMWYDDMVIAATEDSTTWDNELRFFARDVNANLELRCMHIEGMPEAVVAMSNIRDNLIVFTADNIIRFYALNAQQRLFLELYQQVLLEGVVANPYSISSLAWNHSGLSELASKESLKKSPIVMLKNGELSLLRELPDGGWEHVGLSENIEYFWIAEDDGPLCNSVWAVDGHNIKLWTSLEGDDSFKKADGFIRIELDFYPLSIMIERGLIVGLEQRVSLTSNLNSPIFRYETKTHLFIHHVLRDLLRRGMEDEALHFSAAYEHLDYFAHALEMLIYRLLEDEHAKDLGTKEGAILPRAVNFIKLFPHYLDVIVLCARKTEVVVWEYFFKVVGDPKVLFKECLDAGFLTTATSYLIIIQTLEPITVGGKLAADLLDRAFELEDFDTGKELIRFFSTIEGQDGECLRDMTSAARLKFEMRAPNSTRETLENLEHLLHEHAYRLLIRWNFKGLSRFSMVFGISLQKFFEEEKVGLDKFDWSRALYALHHQFEVGLPEALNPKADSPRAALPPQRRSSGDGLSEVSKVGAVQLGVAALSINTVGIHVAPGPKSAPAVPMGYAASEPSRAPLHQHDARLTALEDLNSIADSLIEAQWWSWALLFASVAMNTRKICVILNKQPTYFATWRRVVEDTQAAGYLELLSVIEETVNV